jgi:hypothetical protein
MCGHVPARPEKKIRNAQRRSGRSVRLPLAAALLEAENLCHAQQSSCASRRVHHLPALVGIDSHRLFAQNRLAASDSEQHVVQMAGIRGSDKNGVDFRGSAEFFRRIKRQRNIMLPGRFLRFAHASP